jgi:hypothetical protein
VSPNNQINAEFLPHTVDHLSSKDAADSTMIGSEEAHVDIRISPEQVDSHRVLLSRDLLIL